MTDRQDIFRPFMKQTVTKKPVKEEEAEGPDSPLKKDLHIHFESIHMSPAGHAGSSTIYKHAERKVIHEMWHSSPDRQSHHETEELFIPEHIKTEKELLCFIGEHNLFWLDRDSPVIDEILFRRVAEETVTSETPVTEEVRKKGFFSKFFREKGTK